MMKVQLPGATTYFGLYLSACENSNLDVSCVRILPKDICLPFCEFARIVVDDVFDALR